MGGLFGSSNSKNQPNYTGIPVQTSAQGTCIPLVWGTTRISCNLIWYGDFKKKPKKGAGKGGGKGANTEYYASIMCGLCEGVVVQVGAVFANQSVTSFASSGFGLFPGTQSQAPWAYLTSAHPTQALAYAGTAYVAQTGYDLGSSPSLPSQNFEVTANLLGSNITIADANPADVAYDFLTNKVYGLGMDPSLIGDVTLYRAYTWAADLLFSPALDTQEQVTSTLQRWAQITNTWIFWSGSQMKFVPLGDTALSGSGYTYTPSISPIYNLTYDDILADDSTTPPLQVDRIDPADGYNWVQIDCRDRTNQYNNTSILWQDQASIDQYGVLASNQVQANEFCDTTRATIAAALIGKRSVYIRNTYTFKLGYTYILLEPGDIVTITDPNLGITRQPIRIVSVEEDEKGLLSVTAEEFPAGIGSSPPLAAPVWAGTVQVNTAVIPPFVNTPAFFEPNPALTGGTPQIWVAVSGGANWGGCSVNISFDGTSFTNIGQVTQGSLQGVLTAALPSHADPDTTNTMSIDVTECLGSMPATATHADADAGRTTVLVDGEVVTYGAVTPTGTYTSDLTYLRRGQYATSPAAHSTGAPWSRFDQTVCFIYNLPAQYVGATLYFKFCSVNQFQQQGQDISTVVEYSFVPTGAAFPIPAQPTSPSAAAAGTGATVSWSGASGATSYQVWRAAGSGPFSGAVQVGTSVGSPWTDTTSAATTAYTYYVVPQNANGAGPVSTGAAVTTGSGASGSQPYDIVAFYPGTMSAGQTLYRLEMVRSVVLPASLTGSRAACVVAPTGSVTMAIRQNGTSIGTINFAAAATAATFTFASAVTLVAGDFLEVDAPASTDVTFASPSWTVTGTR